MTCRHAVALAALLFMSPHLPASAEQPAPRLASDAVPDWSGPYLGLALAAPQGGNSWRQASSGLELVPGDWRGNGLVLSLGHDWQRNRLTYGARIDYGPGSHVARPRNALFINCADCATEVDNLTTLTGRIGLAAGKAHLFAEGGWARGSVTATNLGGLLTYADADLSGWTLAVGAERQVADGLSLTIRYDHIDLGAQPLPDYVPTGETRIEIGRMQIGFASRW
ncbi:outer membrane protein [Rhodobacter calidifons]|uniref:Porin family protein n=1 Tax=Rhodobacter calidifons TaxID=2715277 RepID=A0ABX0G6K6_9RHOB|nr:outer membrane beta-barrel protein [Rhodobacter calidifons]NHB76850.1 porin family protein [Rhodobacter calidifons]